MSQSYSGELVTGVGGTYLRIHFYDTVKYASITNDKFTLLHATATPSTVALKSIDLEEDYNSTSRTLNLFPAENLLANATYELEISGLVNVVSHPLPDDTIVFEIGSSDVVIVEPIPEPIIILDNSLLTAPFTLPGSGGGSGSDTAIEIESTDPPNGSVFLDPDYNDGRIVIKFTARPNDDYINSNYFIVQRKPVQRRPARWESVDAEIELHNVHPWVYINLPSDDEPPVYGEAGKTYLLNNYKYRIRVLETVGA